MLEIPRRISSIKSFRQRILLLTVFFLIAPLVLLSSFTLLIYRDNLNKNILLNNNEDSIFSKTQYGVQVYASLPSKIPSISTEIGSEDARIEIIRQYLYQYNSPLIPFAYQIVESADKHGIDYRLTTAIAQQESNLCKVIPPESYNCWGWGIHSRGTLGFTSYGEGVETVTKGIREKYIDEGYKTIEEIMSKYTPLSKGSWSNGVLTFMKEMQ
jgi:hypothetical protein